MKGRVLIVDDHDEIIYAVRRVLESQGLDVLAASNGRDALSVVDQADAAILDIRLEEESGIDLLERLRAEGNGIPVIILSAYASPDNIVSASKYGAVEILRKPIGSEQLVKAVAQALEKKAAQAPAPAAAIPEMTVQGPAPCMVEVFKSLGLAATNDLSVLLTGETGVGKDVAAHIIHAHSARADGPFVALNSTAMPETLLEAELFGYAAGAFTGAVRSTPGRVESAAGGTLFLDEIGDMPLSCQAKVLRFLEDRTFHRLGESTPRHVDVRLVTATNQDLEELVEQSRFRRDLYYRLAQIPISIPPLRERSQDIESLIKGFVAAVNRELDLQIEGVTEQALEQARAHAWPGNVRELKNTVYRTAAKQKTGLLERLDLKPEQPSVEAGNADDMLHAIIESAIAQGRLRELMSRFEEEVLTLALDRYNGNKSRVAEVMDISRNTLRARLREFGLLSDIKESSGA
ncbi:sigma-54-dependent transcriptional regulator [Thioalkalivibrio thiocyanodenitrificans]|uniref:sigma-54-dependent transcriptional regulator n=1 Tax=Thioalkalivibrio thiocyanodenitrificans TaxID=243063 RepID=UPI0003A30C21|nr:sigma-54 dependent transcriptional regulator [Thioalkalivibrio thiocyanodenitrificans]